MRITVEIDDKTIAKVQKLTGIKKKSPAISKALTEYCLVERKHKLIAKVMEGKTDYSTSNEELEKQSKYDSY